MNASTNFEDPLNPVACYVHPIRSVLFIDDKFPIYGELVQDADEADRARTLWSYCVRRGWLCDVDNGRNWDNVQLPGRITGCDLLVLDYHLGDDQDYRKALQIIDKLSEAPGPSMVVLYTAEPNLDDVLLRTAVAAYGTPNASEDEGDDDDDDDDDLRLEWSVKDFMSYMMGQDEWYTTVEDHFVALNKVAPLRPRARQIIGRKIVNTYRAFGAGPSAARGLNSCSTMMKNCRGLWFQSKNLFMCVVGKPSASMDLSAEGEAERLIAELEIAVKEWNPPWAACLMSLSRRMGEEGAFFDDQSLLPNPDLLEGLLEHIRGDGENGDYERLRHARDIAHHLLYFRFSGATEKLAKLLDQKSKMKSSAVMPKLDKINRTLQLNAFLCSRKFDSHHVTLGTILKIQDGEYVLCVSPSCDMVPRKPRHDRDPWASQLYPIRPTLVIELSLSTPESSVKKANHGLHVFFVEGEEVRAMECFVKGNTPCPRMHTFFLTDQACVSSDLEVRGYRIITKGEQLTQEVFTARPVAQLRAPYAERIAQSVGAHISRIGVDWGSHPA